MKNLGFKVFTTSWQQEKDVMVYNGSSWGSAQDVMVYNGSSWVSAYKFPTAVADTLSTSTGSTLNFSFQINKAPSSGHTFKIMSGDVAVFTRKGQASATGSNYLIKPADAFAASACTGYKDQTLTMRYFPDSDQQYYIDIFTFKCSSSNQYTILLKII